MQNTKEEKSSRIKVSVIIPVYNVEPYLRRCLDSVVNQTLKDIEIICINDGSTDNSLKILEDYAKQDDRFVIISIDNSGAAIARNKGLEIASGLYLGFVDPDDKIDENFYEELYDSAVKNNADIAKGYVVCFDINGKMTYSSLNSAVEKNKFLFKHDWWSAIYKSDLIFNNKINFPENCRKGQDGVFLMRALLASNSIVTTNKTYYHYFRRIDSLDANKISLDSIKSAMYAKKSILDYLNRSDLYQKDKKNYILAYYIRYMSIFYNLFQNDTYVARKECTKALLHCFYECKDRKNLAKKLPYKWILPYIKNNDTEGLSIMLTMCRSNSDLRNMNNHHGKNMAKPYIISLTSYPARINTVYQTIESLLNQTLAAEKIVLWLSDTQFPNLENDLPSNLLKLKEDGLEIEWYHQEHDIKPYNKLINTLKKYPDKIIITVDDDIIYEKDRIIKLYKEYLKNPQYIHCHRAHRILFKNKKILPYNKWEHEIKNVKPSYNNFLTGVGCVLYPPHCFYKDILREDLFVQLAPEADDIWFWAMAVLNGTKINVVKNNYRNLTYVNGTQETALWKTNVTKNQNDPKIQKVLSYYPQILKRLDKHNYFYNNLAEQIFSVKNENMKKIVTILGVRLKFKSKRLKQKQKLQDIEKRLANQQKIINEQQKIIDNLQNVTLKNNQIAALTEIAMLKTKYNWDDIKIPVIKSNSDTVLELINSDKSIIRFGDGDFNIMEGNNICFQNSQPLLAERLKQIIADGDKNLLIGIPYSYYECSINLTNVSQKFILNWFSKWHKIMAKYYNYDRIYYSTHISQMHPEYANYDFETHYNNFKRVWHNKKITIVTGDRVYNNIQYNIFENASEISYIFGPTENAFDKYNELREQLQNVTKDNILIFALGPAGKVLAYDMYKLGYRVLDLGHLIKDYDFYKKSKSMTSDEWNKSRSVFFKKD